MSLERELTAMILRQTAEYTESEALDTKKKVRLLSASILDEIGSPTCDDSSKFEEKADFERRVDLFTEAISTLNAKKLSAYFHAYGFNKKTVSIVLEISSAKRGLLNKNEAAAVDESLFELLDTEPSSDLLETFLQILMEWGNINASKCEEDLWYDISIPAKLACSRHEDLIKFFHTGSNIEINKRYFHAIRSYLRFATRSSWKLVRLIRIFQEFGADVNSMSERGHSILGMMIGKEKYEEAVASEIIAAINMLAEEGFDLTETDGLNTPLMLASYANAVRNTDIYAALLNLGIDPSLQNDRGETAGSLCQRSGSPFGKYLAIYEKDYARGNHKFAWAVATGDISMVRAICEETEDAVLKDEYGEPLIFRAVWFGKIEMLKFLVERGLDLRKTNATWVNALQYAIQEEQVEVVRYLIEACPSLNSVDSHGNDAFMSAVDGCKKEIAYALFNGKADGSVKNKNGENVLHLFFQKHIRSERDLLEKLLTLDVPMNNVDARWETPLHIFIKNWWSYEGHVFGEILDLLISKGADIEIPNRGWATPLMVASQWNHDNAVRALLKRGAKLDKLDADGKNALDYSIRKKESCRSNHETVKLLIEAWISEFDPDAFVKVVSYAETYESDKRGDWNNRDYEEHWAKIDTFSQYEKDSATGVLPILSAAANGDVKRCERLVSADADLNRGNDKRYFPLFLAVANGHANAVDFFLRHGANPFLLAEKNMSLLHFVLCKRRTIGPYWDETFTEYFHETNLTEDLAQVLEKILKLGLDINAKDASGMTPLLHAMDAGLPISILSLLIRNGANVNVQDSKGRSAFHLRFQSDNARTSGKDELSQLLRLFCDNGYDLNLLDGSGETILVDSIWIRSTGLLKELIELWLDADLYASEGRRGVTILENQLLEYRKARGWYNDDTSSFLESSIKLLGGRICYWDQRGK